MTINFRRFGALALILVGMALSIGTQSAHANEYTEYPCWGYERIDLWLWDSNTDDNWMGDQECPDGYRLFNLQDGTPEDEHGEFTIESTYADIQSVSAIVAHTDDPEIGIKVSIQACHLSTCGPAVSSNGDEASYLELDIDDGEIPTGAVTLRVTTECVIEVCPSGGAVRLQNLQVTRSDETPPIFSLFEIDDDFEPLPEAAKWNNGLLKWNFEGDDPESSLGSFEVEIENINLCYSLFLPWVLFPDCTTLPNQASPDIFASDLPDGHHDLAFSLTNRAGLTTTHSVTVKTDATPPGQPHQFEVIPHFNDWQNSRNVRIDWTNPGETVETDAQSGIAGFTYDVAPKFGGMNPPTSDEDPEKITVKESAADSVQIRLPSAGQWTVDIQTFDRAGNVSLIGTAPVNIDDARPAAPNVDDIPPINIADRTNGRTIGWDPGEPPVSRLCGYEWAFSAIPGFNPGEDPSSPLLGDDPLEVHLTPSQVEALSERPQKFHLRNYSCAGTPGEIAHEPVLVDFTAPSISISPSSGMLAGGELVAIAVQDVKAGTIQSGVASVTCLVNTHPVPCANGSQLTLVSGPNHIVVTATDNAGNSTTAQADLLADSASPTGWIDRADPADPTLVRATVRDVGSGLRSAELEFKSAAGGAWSNLGNGFDTDHPTTDAVVLTARIPDEGELANGDYLLRVRATDSVGGSAVISQRAGGDGAGFSIPLRAGAVLTAGLLKSSRAKAAPLSRLGVKYGAKPVLVGALKRTDGTPIAGAQLSIVEDQSGSPTYTIGSVTTGADGSFLQRVPQGGSRRLTVRFAGNLAARATAADAQLRVAGKVTLRSSRSSVHSNATLHLRGKVYAAGAVLPLIGKAVELRFTIAGRRSSWTRTTRTDAAGRFDFRFRHTVRGRPVRFAVRAVATREPTWAFSEGVSNQATFVVKP